MRRLLALVTAVAVTFSLAAVPADAMEPLRLLSTRLLTPGATTKIEVAAESGLDITEVRAVVRPWEGGTATPLTVDDFELVEGTATNGVWRTRTAITVDPGRWWVDIELTNSERSLTERSRALLDNGTDTVISDFEVTPTTIDVEHPRIAFRGRLMSRTADGALSPLADTALRLSGNGGQAISVVTGADGRAEGTADFTMSANAQLSYGGTFLYRPSASAAVRVTKQRLKTRLTMNLPDRPAVGDRIPMTGRLERQDRDGSWGPLAGKRLNLRFNSPSLPYWNTIATPVTDANGDYSVQVLVETGIWEIYFANDPTNLPDDYYNYEMSYADSGSVRQFTHRTSISGFNAAPEPVARGGTIRASGTVMFTMADGTKRPADGGTVWLQFSADGKTWKDKATQSLGGDGWFAIDVKAERDGYWRARVPDGDGYPVVPSVSGADYVDVRYQTRILDFNAAPEPVKKGGTVTVMGTLYRQTSKWYTYGGKTITFYFLPKGSSKWVYMGKQTTDRIGRFRKGFKATKDGTWRAYSGATSTYAKTYRDDYVDVR